MLSWWRHSSKNMARRCSTPCYWSRSDYPAWSDETNSRSMVSFISLPAANFFLQIVLLRVTKAVKSGTDDSQASIWSMLEALDDSMQRYLQQVKEDVKYHPLKQCVLRPLQQWLNKAWSQKILFDLWRRRKIPRSPWTAAFTTLIDNKQGIWIFLRDLSLFYPDKIDCGGIAKAWWRHMDSKESNEKIEFLKVV